MLIWLISRQDLTFKSQLISRAVRRTIVRITYFLTAKINICYTYAIQGLSIVFCLRKFSDINLDRSFDRFAETLLKCNLFSRVPKRDWNTTYVAYRIRTTTFTDSRGYDIYIHVRINTANTTRKCSVRFTFDRSIMFLRNNDRSKRNRSQFSGE